MWKGQGRSTWISVVFCLWHICLFCLLRICLFFQGKPLKHLSESHMILMTPKKVWNHCPNFLLPPRLLALLNSLNKANFTYQCSPLHLLSLHPSSYLPCPPSPLHYIFLLKNMTKWGTIWHWGTVLTSEISHLGVSRVKMYLALGYSDSKF